MAAITDYLDPGALRELQEAYSAACGWRILICDGEGRPLVDSPVPSPEARSPEVLFQAPVLVDDEPLARVLLLDRSEAGKLTEDDRQWLARFTNLTADMVSRLAMSQKHLRNRAAELATLYRLTAEFAAQRDLHAVLDLVSKTVVNVFDAKACTIRLLSEDRTELIIMAAANLSPEYLNKGPILLSESKIDKMVLDQHQPVYIADERTDPRVLYPAEAKREGIASALCAPLIYKGRDEGVIRVYTAEVHEFDWFEISLLKAIAAQAAAAIVNARLYQEALRLANVRRQLRLAAAVQRRMIPRHPPVVEGLDIGCAYVPCFELGGDFFDFIQLPGNNLAVAVCDVAGKGVRASLLMASTRAYLHAHASNIYAMPEVLSRVNRGLCADTLSSDFATLFYGVIEVQTRRFTYANAGHPPALLIRDHQCRHLTTGGMVVGVDPEAQWDYDTFVLDSGDVIVIYTDGLSEALNFSDEAFGKQRIEAAAMEAVDLGLSAEATVRHILWKMRTFAGLQKRPDDLTLVAIKVL